MGNGCQGGCRSFHLSDRSGELTLAGRGQEERICGERETFPTGAEDALGHVRGDVSMESDQEHGVCSQAELDENPGSAS